MYQIEIIETLSRIVVVDSDDLSDAIQKVKKDYYSEKIVLDDNDFLQVEFEEWKETE